MALGCAVLSGLCHIFGFFYNSKHEFLDAVVTTSTLSTSGYTTYRLTASLHGPARSLYSIEGTPEAAMELPAAYQAIPPFGVDTGGVNPQFYAFVADAEFDSWLTAGITTGDDGGAISSVGIEFALWTEADGLEIADGAIFWMDPSSAPEGDSVVAQLTVPAGSSGQMTGGLQGRSVGGDNAQDWQQFDVVWAYP